METDFLFSNIYYLILILISIFSIYNFLSFSNNYKFLAILIILSTIMELSIGYSYTSSSQSNSNVLYHYLLPLNMLIFFITFKGFWNNDLLKKILATITIVFIILSILNSIYNKEYNNYPSNGLVLLCVLSVLLSLVTLKDILSSTADIPLFIRSEFWLAITVLIFYTFSFVYFSFFMFYSSIIKENYIIYVIFKVVLYLYYILLGYSLYLNKKTNIEN